MAESLSDLFRAASATKLSPVAAVFEEEPVPLDVFIRDAKFLGQSNIRLSKTQSDVVRYAERVFLDGIDQRPTGELDANQMPVTEEFYTPELDTYRLLAENGEHSDYWSEPLPMKNLITVQWGKGSGKDAVSRYTSLRVAYLLLCLKDPRTYFGLPDTDFIHLMNVATNAQQAREAFFDPMVNFIGRGWFEDRAEVKQGEIQYDKGVRAISGHSDATSLEGRNIMLGVADEIDGFKSKHEMIGQGKKAREASTSAEKILQLLLSSAASRFPRTFKRIAISYPQYRGSTIQRLTAEGRASIEKLGEKSIHFVSGPLKTWEVNPRVHGWWDFKQQYEEDPVAARAAYECDPPMATSPLAFPRPEFFTQATDRTEQPIKVVYRQVPNPRAGGEALWEVDFLFAEDFRPIDGAYYAVHCDMAEVGDRAGVSMSHVERMDERLVTVVDDDGTPSGQEVQQVPTVRNDFTIGFEADLNAAPPRKIQIRWARELIFKLIDRGFVIGKVTFDGFQSTDSLQVLSRRGIAAERLSADLVSTPVWNSLEDLASDGRLHMAYSFQLMKELTELVRLKTGKIEHLSTGSKDFADAFACSIHSAIMIGGQEAEGGDYADPASNPFAIGTEVMSDFQMPGMTGMMDPFTYLRRGSVPGLSGGAYVG